MTIKLLAIDASTTACSVALLYDNNILEKFQVAPRQHNELLLPMVDSVLAEANIALNQCDAIAVANGPGSFTGLRLACSVAQGLAFGADLPVIPISTLLTLAQTTYRLHQATHVLTCLDARMNQVYFAAAQLSENHLMQLTQNEIVVAPETLTLPGNDPWLAVGDGFAVYAEQLKNIIHNTHPIKAITDIYPHAQDAAQLAVRSYQQKLLFKPEELIPNYLQRDLFKRKTQGVKSRKHT